MRSLPKWRTYVSFVFHGKGKSRTVLKPTAGHGRFKFKDIAYKDLSVQNSVSTHVKSWRSLTQICRRNLIGLPSCNGCRPNLTLIDSNGTELVPVKTIVDLRRRNE